MPMEPAVLDTDILSAILKKDPPAIPKAKNYLSEHGRFTFSILTRYEILRGLKAKSATTQLAASDLFCAQNEILPLTDAVVTIAADIYAGLTRRGEPIGDADILIAASALVRGWAVVTNNERHFRRIPGLKVENWLQ